LFLKNREKRVRGDRKKRKRLEKLKECVNSKGRDKRFSENGQGQDLLEIRTKEVAVGGPDTPDKEERMKRN
jgi:hypothetical protein